MADARARAVIVRGSLVVLFAVLALGCRGRSRPIDAGGVDDVGGPSRSAEPVVVEDGQPTASGPFRVRKPAEGRVFRLADASRHRGVLLRGPSGASVRAAADGRVMFITASYPGMGPTIALDHVSGYRTLYGPVEPRKGLEEGARIRAGEPIGHLASERGLLRFRLLRNETDVENLFDFAAFEPAGTMTDEGVETDADPDLR